MTPINSLKYRIREDGSAWLWEVFTDGGQMIASGKESTDTTLRAGLWAMSPEKAPAI